MSDTEFDPRSRMINIPGRRGLHGGAYLPARMRMLWFRQEHPNGSIQTELIELTDQRAVFKCTVSWPVYTPRLNDEDGQWVDIVHCVGHGSETKGDFPDYIEKAETKAIARALGAAGYGTEGAFEEGEGRPADAPVHTVGKATPSQLKQITDLVNLIPGMSEHFGTHLKGEYNVDETPELSFEDARELIQRLRVKLEKGQAAPV